MSVRTFALVGLTSVGLLAPIAATAAPATLPMTAPAAKRVVQQQYTAQIAGARVTQTSDFGFGTAAQGVSNGGLVLVSTRSGDSVGLSVVDPTRRKQTALPSTASVSNRPRGGVITPGGTVYTTGDTSVVRFTRTGFTVTPIVGAGTAYYGASIAAANDRGDVAGCVSSVKVGYPFAGNVLRGTVRQVGWPVGEGNCEVNGISARGVAAVTQHNPYFQHVGVYPKAATLTSSGTVTYLRVPEGTPASADGISPSGRLVVGRTYKDGVATVSWLSPKADPVPLAGAGAMVPEFVTDSGMVVGTENGRVVTWFKGRKTDLTSVARMPQGWVATSVAGVNARGQVAVTATLPGTRETVAMLLTPTRR